MTYPVHLFIIIKLILIPWVSLFSFITTTEWKKCNRNYSIHVNNKIFVISIKTDVIDIVKISEIFSNILLQLQQMWKIERKVYRKKCTVCLHTERERKKRSYSLSKEQYVNPIDLNICIVLIDYTIFSSIFYTYRDSRKRVLNISKISTMLITSVSFFFYCFILDSSRWYYLHF